MKCNLIKFRFPKHFLVYVCFIFSSLLGEDSEDKTFSFNAYLVKKKRANLNWVCPRNIRVRFRLLETAVIIGYLRADLTSSITQSSCFLI